MNYNNNLCAPPKALIHSSQSPFPPPAVLQGGGTGGYVDEGSEKS